MKIVTPRHEHEFICECGHMAELWGTERRDYLVHMRRVIGRTKGSKLFGKTYFEDTVKCMEKGCDCKSPVWKRRDGYIIRWSQEKNTVVIVKNGKEHPTISFE